MMPAVKEIYRIHNLLQRIFLALMVMSYGVIKTNSTYSSYACSDANTGNDCIILNLACQQGERIQIMKAVYGFSGSKTSECSSGSSNSNLWSCKSQNYCCAVKGNDTTNPYSPNNMNSLLQRCSWKQNCKPQAALFNGSAYNTVEYDCKAEANTVQFCNSSSVSARNVNLMFENTTNLIEVESTLCQCRITSTETFTVKALDVRLQNAIDECPENNRATLTGLVPNGSITCKDRYYFQHTGLYSNEVLDIWLLLAIYPVNKPQMVLIEATGDSDKNVTAVCFAPGLVPPTTTETYSKQNQTYSSHSSNADVHADNSDDVPVAAIVVPLVVLLLIGVSFALILGRKRCTKIPEKKFPNKDNAQPTSTDNVVHNAAYVHTSLKTSDNYMTLEAEDAYTYIDHGDNIQQKAVLNPENGYNKTAQVNPSHSPVSAFSSEQNRNNCDAEGREPNHLNQTVLNKVHNLNSAETGEAQCPEYLELEPHDTYTSIDPEDVNVQTLADNVYNMINLKGKYITLDPNYGALDVGIDPKSLKGSCEYDHFQTMPNDRTKSNISKYSEVHLNEVRQDTPSNKENQDLSSQGTPTAKTRIFNSEEKDDYSHLNIK